MPKPAVSAGVLVDGATSPPNAWMRYRAARRLDHRRAADLQAHVVAGMSSPPHFESPQIIARSRLGTHESKTVVLTTLNVGKIWKSLVPGLCGAATHASVMFLKAWTGVLPTFHPYLDLQRALGSLVGSSVHPVVPWALSFLNSIVVLGFLFGRIYRLLPGRYGALKGLVFGVVGWIAMGLLFYPALGLGLFASHVGLGVLPALFSLLMVLSYSIVVGIAHSALSPNDAPGSN